MGLRQVNKTLLCMEIRPTVGHGVIHREKGQRDIRKSAVAYMQSIRSQGGKEVGEQEGAGMRNGLHEGGEGS